MNKQMNCERRIKMKQNGISVKYFCNCKGKEDNCHVIEALEEVKSYLSGCCTLGYPR